MVVVRAMQGPAAIVCILVGVVAAIPGRWWVAGGFVLLGIVLGATLPEVGPDELDEFAERYGMSREPREESKREPPGPPLKS